MAETKGILGTKLGMTQIFTEDARAVPVTVIQAGPCTVTQVKTVDKDGYSAVQLAYLELGRGRANKPYAGHFAASGATPTRHLVELRTEQHHPVDRRRVAVHRPARLFEHPESPRLQTFLKRFKQGYQL